MARVFLEGSELCFHLFPKPGSLAFLASLNASQHPSINSFSARINFCCFQPRTITGRVWGQEGSDIWPLYATKHRGTKHAARHPGSGRTALETWKLVAPQGGKVAILSQT